MTALWERFKLYWFTGVKCPRCGGRFPARGNDVSETPKGVTYVCPRFPRLRMLEGVLAFNNAFPDAALIPKTELVSASEELTRLRDQSPAVRSHILTFPSPPAAAMVCMISLYLVVVWFR